MLRKCRAKSPKTTRPLKYKRTNSMARILCLFSRMYIAKLKESVQSLSWICRVPIQSPSGAPPSAPYSALPAPSPSPSPILRYIFLPFVTPIWRNSMGGLEPSCSLGRSARSWTRHRHAEPSLWCCRIISLQWRKSVWFVEITSKTVHGCSKVFHKGTHNTCYIHFKLAVDGEGGGVIEIISWIDMQQRQ